MRPDLHLRQLDLARFHIGVLEIGGDNRGPMVELFQKAVDGIARREPWCMAFLQYCAKRTVEVHGGRLLPFASESCLETWNKTPPAHRSKIPQPGYWAIWQWGTSSSGHAEIVDQALPGGRMRTVGGNTAPEEAIVREGVGVYTRDRSAVISAPGERFRLLGFLKVFG